MKRDELILGKILVYCDRIGKNIARYHGSFEAFRDDLMFQDACCMCVVQIGELVAQLSEKVKAQNPAVPWRVIKDTRNFYVHAYGAIDVASVWETLLEDIPALRASCEEILQRDLTERE